MDIGLVCDQCDTYNPMTVQCCAACGVVLSLESGRGATSPEDGRARVAAPPAAAATPPAAQTTSTTARRDTPPDGSRKTLFFGAMQAARAKLVLIKGDGLDGVSYTLAGQEHAAGRIEGPLLFAEDPFLSPNHANFFYKNGKLLVRDEGSRNGVFLRIKKPTMIRSGDTFLVGEQLLRLEATPPETAGLGPSADGTYFYASPRRAATLRIVQLLRGGEAGLILRPPGDKVTLGRDGNDVNFPDDPFISGQHAQVSFVGTGFVLADLSSRNGTFLRIHMETPLEHGDYVFMGQQLLRVEIV